MDDDQDSVRRAIPPDPAPEKGSLTRERVRRPLGNWLILTIVVLMGVGFLCVGVYFISNPARDDSGEIRQVIPKTSPSVISSHVQNGVLPWTDVSGRDITTSSPALPTDPFGGVFHEKRDEGDTGAQAHPEPTTRLTTTTSIVKTRFVYQTIVHTAILSATADDGEPAATGSAAATSVLTTVALADSLSPTSTSSPEPKYCPMEGSPDVYIPCDPDRRGGAVQNAVVVVAPAAASSSGSSLAASSGTLRVIRGLARAYSHARLATYQVLCTVGTRPC
ncbi:hypothetical protein Micbo1qcDRAFT_208874 [Microdochium bolleyi]|uniref:Uncharacterized protein n=1 Tax=Microdochium bolleyi TaxID=196109 RepID=A0A136IP89_9PEZI|nr:hypothetical protein Micbo1qcDRAFT_208874 [Microdochium bolleyi]